MKSAVPRLPLNRFKAAPHQLGFVCSREQVQEGGMLALRLSSPCPRLQQRRQLNPLVGQGQLLEMSLLLLAVQAMADEEINRSPLEPDRAEGSGSVVLQRGFLCHPKKDAHSK